MLNKENLRPLYREESEGGSYGHFHLVIQADAKIDTFMSEPIREATYQAAEIIKAAILSEAIKQNPASMENAKKEREQLLALFPFAPDWLVDEIPNGYCSSFCCKHLPWFVVATPVGKIKIGWRKRVIQIEWSETKNTKTAYELFEAEDVTKDTRMIHAWSYEKAKQYIAAILESAK